ncbi:hypothetical protein CAPTEDRAFT_151775 [Capitella teleta]|uniref:Importin N-terminal domain-containing protein n=1 Tax=Capitella teleta TaxID=283909 RepID=R7UKF7_CAPTE|nr:hypothetical protein CAPTEDRAFT_151775 [Capitella teleta]|eukprot:ELU03767.1 hypothetical protein CAPTEDRAFT_151775 [Capitella teleta]
MDPNTAPLNRSQAYQACENFKETSEHCAQCGFLLCEKSQEPIFRHFGLQLLEHCIRIRWNNLQGAEKVFIKDQSMALLASGTLNMLHEEAHIKDALSRVVVEMIKREWPQQWPSLMQELDALCSIGPTQTELVLLILLRLAEDVLIFQTVPNQRRREIMQGLTSSLSQLHEYFLRTLDLHFDAYLKTNSLTEDQRTEAAMHCRVTASVVNTLTGFVEWIGWSYLAEQNGHLFQVLCSMLADPHLQLPAAECLLLICSRKGKVDERKPLMLLFCEEAMVSILRAATEAASAELNEHHYAFLKRLCQVLCALGNQLCALWGASGGVVDQPDSFSYYLNAILAFTRHSSQMLSNYTQTLWIALLRHPIISQSQALLNIIPLVLNTTHTSLLKVGFPSQSNSPACDYSRLDFDSDEDFNAFFSKYRQEISEVIRQTTLLLPSLTFQYASDWLQSLLKKPLNTASADSLCTLNSPTYLEWDALALFLDCVMGRMSISEKQKPPAKNGVQLLEAVLAFEIQDPLVLSSVLSCSSSLFPYINDSPDILSVVLDKMFNAAVFNVQGQTKSNRSRAVRNVRLHACSGLVKIAKEYPNLLLPGFDQLYSHIQNLMSELSSLEQCTLTEALILISNQFRNFDKQSQFLGEILSPVKERWLSPDLKQSVWSVEMFMMYVGLDQPQVEPSTEDTCGINRSYILYCINTIFAVLKRSAWPDDLQAAEAGGFVIASKDGCKVMRNPVLPHLIMLLDNVLALIRTLNALWLPENLAKRHMDFNCAFDVLDVDKKQIMGQIAPSVEIDSTSCKQPLQRMQSFLTTVHFNCYHIIGNAGPMLGHEFYQAPALASSLINSIFTHLHCQPDYRVKPIIRAFIKPFTQSCPPEFYEPVLLPVLGALCPYMLQRLTSKWQKLNENLRESNEDQEEQEVLEEQLIRLLTREYLEFIVCLFRGKKGSIKGEAGMDEENSDAKSSTEDEVSTLGKLVLASEGLYAPIVMTLFSGLSWNDTITSFKCIALCWPVVKQLLATNKVTSEDACFVLTAVLRGLEQHGEHDGHQAALISLALMLYENLRPLFPEIINVLKQVPNCSENLVKQFDEKLSSQTAQKAMTEKRKKDSFKKLVQGVIGMNIGQRFRQEIHIKNLPPLFRQAKARRSPLEEQNGDIGLCSLFAHDD